MSLIWNGKGWIHGIPARDLTDEEVKQFGEKMLLASGAYEKPAEKKPVIRKVEPEEESE